VKRKLEIEVDCEDSTCGGCWKGRQGDGWCLEFEKYRERSDGAPSTGYPVVRAGPYPRKRLAACLASEVPARTCGTCRHYRSDGVCKLDGCDRVHDEGCPKWEACHLGVVKVGTPLFRDGDSVSATPSSPTDRPVGFACPVDDCPRCHGTGWRATTTAGGHMRCKCPAGRDKPWDR
jgi:hypothetical protein